jgi:hypothetical protein
MKTTERRSRARQVRLTLLALGAALLGAGGCTLLVGSELSDKPAEATGGGAGGAGGQGSSSVGSAQASTAQGSSAQASSGPGGPTGGPGSSSASVGSGGMMCSADLADCDKKLENGCEVNIKTDKDNCGACKHKCMNGDHCNEMKCSK